MSVQSKIDLSERRLEVYELRERGMGVGEIVRYLVASGMDVNEGQVRHDLRKISEMQMEGVVDRMDEYVSEAVGELNRIKAMAEVGWYGSIETVERVKKRVGTQRIGKKWGFRGGKKGGNDGGESETVIGWQLGEEGEVGEEIEVRREGGGDARYLGVMLQAVGKIAEVRGVIKKGRTVIKNTAQQQVTMSKTYIGINPEEWKKMNEERVKEEEIIGEIIEGGLLGGSE